MRLFALLLLLVPFTASAGKPKPDAASLEAWVRDLFAAHFDKMDMDFPVDAEKLVMFVSDETGAPVVAHDEASVKSMRDRFAAWKAGGWAMTTTFHQITCEVSATLGLCTATYAQHLTEGDKDQGIIQIRGSIVARPTKTGWSLVHLHESPAPAP